MRWAGLSLIGKGSEFYRNDPQGYEAVARALMGREEVAKSIRNVVDCAANGHHRNIAVDAACGTGLVTDALAGSAQRVIGSDLCDEALAFAQASKHPSLEFRCADLHDFSAFETASIDVYSLAFAHRYINDLQEFYASLAGALAGDGSAVITTVQRARTLAAVQQCCDRVGLVMRVVRPKFRSLFNRMHKTSHLVLKHK